MGWVKKNLAHGKKVEGIIIADEIDEKLQYATVNVPDIYLYEYELNIRFNPVERY